MRWLHISLLCTIMLAASAQKDAASANNIKFTATVGAALLTAASENNYAIKAAAGIKLNRWQVSGGAAYDKYVYKSFPFFISIANNFWRQWKVSAEGGINLPERRLLSAEPWLVRRYYNGAYAAAFVHYPLKIWRSTALLVGFGYSYKSSTMEEQGSGSWPFSTQEKYRFRRAALQMAVQF